jgi:trimeric autotransporter adhesin
MSTLPTTVRDDALTPSTDLAQAGAVFNDATRLLDGGLWSNPADSHNQPAYLGMYTTDTQAVLNDVNAALANPGGVTVNGGAYTLTAADTAALTQVQAQLQTLLTEAPQSVGNSHAATTAQDTIHTTQTAILNEINGDAALASALGANPYPGGTGAPNVGFEALPTGSDNAAAITAATAQDATLGQIGSVFNAATDLAVGGLNHSNLPQFDADMKAISTGLTNLLNNQTALSAIETGEAPTDAALTTIHLQTVLDQINLQTNSFDHEYASNPNVAARATNDNLLDIIDIVQGDVALNTAAGGNGNPGTTGGFAEMPAYLEGTITHYQDNQAQTNFWAQFLAEGNVINNQLDNVAAGNNATPAEISPLITEIQNYEKFGASFSTSQGGVFGARFDNELQGGTLLADSKAAVQGLQGIANGDTGAALAADQAQIQAAGQGFVADANDVSGNNIPLGGGTYVGTATTVAGATSVPGIAQGTIPVAGAASGSTGLATAQNGGGGGNGNGGNAGAGSNGGSAGNDGGHGGNDGGHGNDNHGPVAFIDHVQQAASQNHFELTWHHA